MVFLLFQWLRKTNRKPLLAAVEKMKEGILHYSFMFWLLATLIYVFVHCAIYKLSFCGFLSSELMLLGFISLLLTATSSMIANICIPSKFYNSTFAPCSRSEIDEELEKNLTQDRKLLMVSVLPHLFRRTLNGLNQNTCGKVCDFSIKNKRSIPFFLYTYTRTYLHTYVCLDIYECLCSIF